MRFAAPTTCTWCEMEVVLVVLSLGTWLRSVLGSAGDLAKEVGARNALRVFRQRLRLSTEICQSKVLKTSLSFPLPVLEKEMFLVWPR